MKELWQNNTIRGFAVGRKIDEGWYWYEAVGESVAADGVDVGLCSSCHAGAPRDFVFTQVR